MLAFHLPSSLLLRLLRELLFEAGLLPLVVPLVIDGHALILRLLSCFDCHLLWPVQLLHTGVVRRLVLSLVRPIDRDNWNVA